MVCCRPIGRADRPHLVVAVHQNRRVARSVGRVEQLCMLCQPDQDLRLRPLGLQTVSPLVTALTSSGRR